MVNEKYGRAVLNDGRAVLDEKYGEVRQGGAS